MSDIHFDLICPHCRQRVQGFAPLEPTTTEGEHQMSYKIVRYFERLEEGRETVRTGLSLSAAQALLGDQESSSATAESDEAKERTAKRGAWFDGWTKEVD